MTEPRPFRFRSSRLTLAGWEWGGAASPPLLLVHGGRDLARSWDAVAEAFAGEARVIAPDLRGHGESDWANDGGYAMTDFVADLAALIDGIGGGPVDLVGHSFGGNIAWRYAAAFPERVRRLAIVEGLGPSPSRQAEVEARPIAERLRADVTGRLRERKARIYPDLAAAVARLRAANPRMSAPLARHVAAFGTRAVEGGVSFRHDPGLAAWESIDLTMAERRALWAAIPMPVLLVYGRESWASDPQADGRADAFPDARTLMLEGAGHWAHHDRHDAFVTALRAFLTA